MSPRRAQTFDLNARFYLDAKLRKVGNAAELLFVHGLGVARKTGTDWLLTRRQVLTLGLEDIDARIAELVDAGLWRPAGRGWQVMPRPPRSQQWRADW